MKLFFRYLLALLLVLFPSCRDENKTSTKQSAPTTKENGEETPQDWQSLFNGKDLAGWTMKINGHPLGENFANTFRVEDGLLQIRYDGYGPDLAGRFGTLYVDRPLKSYRLKVEYRFVGETAAGAPDWSFRDSGIQFHGQPPETQEMDQPFPICLEYNFHGGNGTEDRPLGALCGYGIHFEVDGNRNEQSCVQATLPRTFHGDQWVTAEIDVRGDTITHYVNGEQILVATRPRYDRSDPRVQQVFAPGDSVVTQGYVSLQANGHPIDFRKIALLEYEGL